MLSKDNVDLHPTDLSSHQHSVCYNVATLVRYRNCSHIIFAIFWKKYRKINELLNFLFICSRTSQPHNSILYFNRGISNSQFFKHYRMSHRAPPNPHADKRVRLCPLGPSVMFKKLAVKWASTKIPSYLNASVLQKFMARSVI